MSNWQLIRDDPELGLTEKLMLGGDASPNERTLRRRAEYLLGRMLDNHPISPYIRKHYTFTSKSTLQAPIRSTVSVLGKRKTPPRDASPLLAASAAGRRSPIPLAPTSLTSHSHGVSGAASSPIRVPSPKPEAESLAASPSRESSQTVESKPTRSPTLVEISDSDDDEVQLIERNPLKIPVKRKTSRAPSMYVFTVYLTSSFAIFLFRLVCSGSDVEVMEYNPPLIPPAPNTPRSTSTCVPQCTDSALFYADIGRSSVT